MLQCKQHTCGSLHGLTQAESPSTQHQPSALGRCRNLGSVKRQRVIRAAATSNGVTRTTFAVDPPTLEGAQPSTLKPAEEAVPKPSCPLMDKELRPGKLSCRLNLRSMALQVKVVTKSWSAQTSALN